MSPCQKFDVYSAVAPRDRNARGPATSFPLKLHQMLDKAEQCGYQHVVSWLPGGKSFQIHNPEGMVTILKTQFNQTKYKSFLRQIQNYGFHRFTRGPKKGVCTHKLFVQWDPLLCLQMKRTNKANNSSANGAGSAGRLSPTMSSMVFQGHCLKTTSVGSLNKEALDPVMTVVAPTTSAMITMKNAPFAVNQEVVTTSKILNHFKPLTYETQENAEDDDAWLTKLLSHQDLWMASTIDHDEVVHFDSMFEPNQVVFPERSDNRSPAVDISFESLLMM
jgi:hypothetical protein